MPQHPGVNLYGVWAMAAFIGTQSQIGCPLANLRPLGFARPRSWPRLLRLVVSQTDVFHGLLLLHLFWVEAGGAAVADFSVTVSSNKARHILI
jgi:hypothetical protein